MLHRGQNASNTMSHLSPLAPDSPSGPGITPNAPFRTVSIMHAYNLMDRLRFRSAKGSCKVRYDRVRSVTSPGFSHPIDHYFLFEGDESSDRPKGKLMDFYVYSYADRPHRDEDLPAGLTVVKFDADDRRKMDEMLEKNPEMKRLFEQQALMQINMARLQRGLTPLDKLPQKGSCLIAAFALLAAGSGLGWALTHIIS